MDSNLLAIIAIGVLIIIIGLGALKGLGRRKLRETATNRRVTKVPEMLQEYGRSVIVGTDAAGAVALVEGLPKRKVKTLRPGVWGVNYVAADDVLIEVRPAGAGSEVLVTSVTEYLGFPQGLDKWQHFSSQLEAAAAAAGIPVQRGAVALRYQPAPPNTLDNPRWLLATVPVK